MRKDGIYSGLPKNGPGAIAQVSSETAGRENLAKGATVRAGSTLEPTYGAANVVDGNRSDASRWISAKKGENWIELDLGTPKKFNTVNVVSGWKQGARDVAKNIAIQTQVNGAWQTLPNAEVNGNTLTECVIALAQPVKAQRVRVVSRDKGMVRIYEVELFNDASDKRRL